MKNSMITEQTPNVSLQSAIEALFRQKRMFLGVFFAVFAATLLLILLMPRKYGSEVKFLVTNARGNATVTTQPTNQATPATDVTETQVNSEIEILNSHDVIDPIADPGWDNMSASQRDEAKTDEHEKLVNGFVKRLEVGAVRKTNIIAVSYLDATPQQAQEMLRRLSTAYLAQHRLMQRPSGSRGFFEAEAQRNRQAWEESNAKLANFQQQHQLVSVADQEATLTKQIAAVDDDLRVTDASVSDATGRLGEGKRQLTNLPARQKTLERTLPNQNSVEELNTLLVHLQIDRTNLLTKYQPTDRLVKEVDDKIASTRGALNDANVSTSHEQTTDVDPAYQEVKTSYVQSQIGLSGAAAHRERSAAQLAVLKQKLAELQALTVQFETLQAQTSELRDNYQLYAQKRDQAVIEDAMDEQKLMNVSVAQQPTISYTLVKPRPLLYGMLGFIGALFMAVCAVYLIEASRKTVATPSELDTAARYPLLVSVPVVRQH